MDTKERRAELRKFLEKEYTEKLARAARLGRPRITIELSKLGKFSIEILDDLIDNPDQVLKEMCAAAEETESELPDGFTVRLKGKVPARDVDFYKFRKNHVGGLYRISGTVKIKSGVREVSTVCYGSCNNCGQTLSPILQRYGYPRNGWERCPACKSRNLDIIDVNENQFHFFLEEIPGKVSSTSTLARIRTLCKADLCEPLVERALIPGSRVKVTGIYKNVPIFKGDKRTNDYDDYFEANYIEMSDDTFYKIKWNEEDEKKFKALAEDEKWLDLLRCSIFDDVHGYDHICEAALLQMFSGVTIDDRQGARVRGNFHMLLVGDPGTAKSTILKISQKFAPRATYVVGASASGVGLTATVIRDEGTGQFEISAGVLPMMNNGLVCIDELDKLDDEFKKSLHEALEQQTITISKASINQTLPCETTIIAAANPKHGSYSDYENIFDQIDMATTLINRFDLIFILRETDLDPEEWGKVAKKILTRGRKKELCNDDTNCLDPLFIKKYISYCRQKCNPKLTDEVEEFLSKMFQKMKEMKAANPKGTPPITGRNIEGLRRLSEAISRSRLHDTVTLEDAKRAYSIIERSIRQVGLDIQGNVIAEYVGERKGKDIVARICTVIRSHMDNNQGKPMPMEELESILKLDGFDIGKIDQTMAKLVKEGVLFEPTSGNYKTL